MELTTIFAIILVVYLVIYLVANAIGVDRLRQRGIEAGAPFFVMIKTQRLNASLTRWGKRIPRNFFNIGIVVGFVGMVFGFVLFTSNLIAFFVQPASAGGVVPIIPGVTITGLPLVYMIIGLAVTLLTHEFAHGLACARDNIPIKSAGLLFLLVLFGGFVEPDETVFEENITHPETVPEENKTPPEIVYEEKDTSHETVFEEKTTPPETVSKNKASTSDRMRVLAAGSFSNMIWALVFLILIANFYSLMSIGYYPAGTYVYQIAEGSPAEGVLQVGDVITALNDTKISSWRDLGIFMSNTHAGSSLLIGTSRGNFSVILAQSQSDTNKGYIGIYGADHWAPKQGLEWLPDGTMFAFHTQQIFLWCYIILFSVAIFNLLPIPILDGDKLLYNGLSLRIEDKKTINKIMWPIRIIALVIVIGNIVLTYMTGKSIF